MNDEYFEWLLNYIGINRDDPNGYELLCSILFDTPFYPIVEMDENRWEDGVRYRLIFASEHECGAQPGTDMLASHLDDILGGCNMLELLLSLADRMQYEMEESTFDKPTRFWFYELLANAGLDIYTNAEILSNEEAYFEASKILENIIFRRYDENGFGGLFPLENVFYNQRDSELIIQMNNYLMQTYDITK